MVFLKPIAHAARLHLLQAYMQDLLVAKQSYQAQELFQAIAEEY
jgi:hypothetical protein